MKRMFRLGMNKLKPSIPQLKLLLTSYEFGLWFSRLIFWFHMMKSGFDDHCGFVDSVFTVDLSS